MSIGQVTPEEAAERLRGGACYLDVRTVEEYERAHPPGALNVPLFLSRAGGQVAVNVDFLAVVRAAVDAGEEVLCGCASGVRSWQAARMLADAGFRDVANVTAGFSGRHDPLGRLVEPGWLQRGLPVEEGDGGERGYAALRRRTEAEAE